MRETPIRYRSRVMVTRLLPTPGPPLTGIAVARYYSPTGEAVFSVILDAPTAIGSCMMECAESELVALPDTRACASADRR
jgi:hypothetical protein